MRTRALGLLLILVMGTSIVCADTNNVKLLEANVRPLQHLVEQPEQPAQTPAEPVYDTYCTAFSVNVTQRGWMTAAHCIGDLDLRREHPAQRFIDGHKAHVVAIDWKHDLALLQTASWAQTTQLQLSEAPVELGDRLEVLGYGYGRAKPFYFVGQAAMIEADFFGFTGTLVAIVTAGGVSGAPVVNEAGQVVGVAHAGFGGSPLSNISPIMGITSFGILKAFDQAWVFGH